MSVHNFQFQYISRTWEELFVWRSPILAFVPLSLFGNNRICENRCRQITATYSLLNNNQQTDLFIWIEKRKEIKNVMHTPIYLWQEGLLKEIYASRAHSTFAALAILASLQPKLKR